MNRQAIEEVLRAPTEKSIDALLSDENIVFWVDWREEDDAIVGYCEDIIQTGSLLADLVEVDSKEGFEIYIQYKDQRVKVPLTYSEKDRHITICSLNKVLTPNYEIRYCIDSHGSDTAAFLPLSCRDWEDLSEQFGKSVQKRFYRIAENPNLFTDSMSFRK